MSGLLMGVTAIVLVTVLICVALRREAREQHQAPVERDDQPLAPVFPIAWAPSVRARNRASNGRPQGPRSAA